MVQKIYNNIQPTSYTDQLARIHDIDYLTNHEPVYADLKAIRETDNSLQGLAMRFGLGFRTLADIALMPIGMHKLTHFNRSETGDDEADHQLQREAYRAIGLPYDQFLQ